MKNMLRRTRCRQMHADHSLQLDDPRGDLDQAQAQRVELRHAPHRALRHRNAKAPHDPVGARVQEQPQLVGACLGARRAIGRQVGLPGFDVVLGLTAPAVDILVEPTGVALLQIGDDEARVRTLRADLDAGDDALDAAPTRGPVVKLLEPARLAVLRRGLVERLRRRFQALDMPAQRRGRRDAEDIVEPVGATEVENLGGAIVAVAAHQNLGPGPVGANGAQQAAQKGLDLLAAGAFAGRSTAVMKRPSPSNTTMG